MVVLWLIQSIVKEFKHHHWYLLLALFGVPIFFLLVVVRGYQQDTKAKIEALRKTASSHCGDCDASSASQRRSRLPTGMPAMLRSSPTTPLLTSAATFSRTPGARRGRGRDGRAARARVPEGEIARLRAAARRARRELDRGRARACRGAGPRGCRRPR